ncbi:MAG: tRNA (adenosine(37)-N6)-threonylcarbamoyltransferase complex dimerization subunit type 1 TsaB [Leptolyngbyaceae cyanobacterium]
MIGLAIHTSSPELGLALVDLEQTTQRSQVWPLGRDLTAYLHTCLTEFTQGYAWSELAYIAVAKGPGGFTGTRIGVVVARTLAQQLEIPLFGISSLAAIAQYARSLDHAHSQSPQHTAISLRAQRGEVFGAIFDHSQLPVMPVLSEALYAQADWDAKRQGWPTSCRHVMADGGLAKTVTGVMALAEHRWQQGDRPHWSTVLPYYGQHPVPSLG